MSIRVMSQVWEHSHATGGQLLVLLAIADFSNDDGEAWPSVPTLAKKARISERHTQRVVKQLKAMGELVVDSKASGQWGTNIYRIALKTEGGGNMPPGGDLEVTRGVTFDAQRGDLEVTQSVKNRHKNHGSRPNRNPGGISPQEFLELYASSAPNLPQPRELTNGRVKKIRQRLIIHPDPEWWKRVFTLANKTTFLRGENERRWKADLDWFVTNDENAVKVIEGKYGNGEQTESGKRRYRDFDAERGEPNGPGS